MLGGWLADRFLGTHRAMTIGAFIIAAGHFTLAVPTAPTFFLGLALVAIGTGLFKANASTMVGQLYEQGDQRRDAGFTIFYMGVNVGAFFGQIICGGYFGDSPPLGLALGVRRGRRRDGARPGTLPGARDALPGRHRRAPQPRVAATDARRPPRR